MLNHNCPLCSSHLKLIPADHLLHTHFPEKPVVVVEQLLFERCSVCEFEILTEESAAIVDRLKEFYQREHTRTVLNDVPERAHFSLRFRRG